jgi:hypothetical protein
MEEGTADVAVDSDNLSIFSHQVAGHKSSSNMLTYMNKFVLKPLIKSDLFQREKTFYEQITRSKSDLGLLNYLPFIPGYHGVLNVRSDAPERRTVEYLVLEDLTLSYSLPNVMDIKIGMKTYEPSASVEKIQKEIEKYPPQATVGFRITGFKYYDTFNEKYTSFDKQFGRSLRKPEEIAHGLSLCFPRTSTGAPLYRNVLRSVIEQLDKQVLSWVENQRNYCFYSSSILIVYSSDSTDSQVEGKGARPNHKKALASVSMIDFAHVVPEWDDDLNKNHQLLISPPGLAASTAGGDDNYIKGLISLIKHLRAVEMNDG